MTKITTQNYQALEDLGSAEKYIDDIHAMIGEIVLFDNFTRNEVATLCGYLNCYATHSNCELVTEGDAGDSLFLILTGKVVVTKKDVLGESILIDEVCVGGIVGEISLVDAMPRFATCTTLMPTDVAVLTRASLNAVLLNHPRLGNKILMTLLKTSAIRLRVITNKLVQCKHLTRTSGLFDES